MKLIITALVFALMATGCASTAPEKAAGWSPPPFPSSPKPIPVKRHFGLPPPRYPEYERRAGIFGEVLLEVVVDENHRLSSWKVLRATTDGYAQSVLATMSKKGQALDATPGVYLYSVVFSVYGDSHDDSRPATFWVGASDFGSR